MRTTGPRSRPSFRTAPDPLPPLVQSAIVVPLHRAGEPVGAVEFLFDRPNTLDDELVAVASTAAGLAEQALERARLYERERETNRALERILQVAPRFYAETAEEVTAVICREARTTFGADYGVLWRIRGEDLELVNSAPRRAEWPLGLRVPLADFPGLADAVSGLGVSFVPDVASEARDEGLERVRELGIRSSLRSPIVIGGRSELVLARVVADGDRSAGCDHDRDRPALRRSGRPCVRAARAPTGGGARYGARPGDGTPPGGHCGALAGGQQRSCRRHVLEACVAVRRSGCGIRRSHGVGRNVGADALDRRLLRGGARGVECTRSRRRRALRASDRERRARLGAVTRRDGRLHRRSRARRRRLGLPAAPNARRHSRRATRLAP